MNQYKLFYTLIILIVIDIIITIYGIMYFGAIELNPLCTNFIDFLFIKILVSFLGIMGIWYLMNHKYIGIFIIFLIIAYGTAMINNIWQTVNYLYY
jgi:hypothetical protein